MAKPVFRVELRLENAIGLGPEWLPVAVRSSLAGGELLAVESYSETSSVVLLSANARPVIGQSITPGAEGMSLPLAASPKGTIVNVSDAVDVVLPGTSDPGKAALSILAAVGILGVVWYLVSRIS